MPLTITCVQSRRADQIAIEKLGIPGIVLMENAARQAAEAAVGMLRRRNRSTGPVVILCGKGNNAGDGYAMARHLASAGYDVLIHALADPLTLTGDARINADIAAKMGLPITILPDEAAVRDHQSIWLRAMLLIDAMLGTGFKGQLRQPYAQAVSQCNELHQIGHPVLAVDIPTGLDGDTGLPCPVAIEADVTVTFVARKQGFLQPEASRFTGKVVVCDIGIAPHWLVEQEDSSAAV